MNQFRKFMYGRYGFDQLTQGLILISLVLTIVTMFLRINVLVLMSYVPFAIALFRVFSKNIGKRSKENYAYVTLVNTVKGWIHQWKLVTFGTKTHKYYRCSKCRQTIRVPRGKGRICISCPKCKTEFIKRT